MKAVILAAGRGTRMGALTETLPKPLLELDGKTLLEYKLDALPESVDGVVMVIGYLGDRIRERLGEAYAGIPITYVTQDVLDGTAGALWTARPYLDGRFVVMMGDDIYAKEDVATCLGMDDWAMLVSEYRGTGGAGGRVVMDGDRVTAIDEGVFEGAVLANTNLFALDPRVFDFPLIPKSPGSSEYGLPQTVLSAAQQGKVPLTAVRTEKWKQVTAPEDLAL